MPGVTEGTAATSTAERRGIRSIFSQCANPRCGTGWIRLWRNRRLPVFEGHWACSADCMADLVATAVRREMDSGGFVPHSHRMPMGLTLVEQGQISGEQLREALAGQHRAAERSGKVPRLGEWLVTSGVLNETVLTRALSSQWNCPVLPLEGFRAEEVVAALPHLLAEATGALPVRVTGGRLLYLAFAEGIDRSLSYAVQAMTGLRVVAGIARDSELRAAQRRYQQTPGPRARYLEASDSWQLARALTKYIESERPSEARLRRVRNWFWLRMWQRPPGPAAPEPAAVEDLIGTIGRPAPAAPRNEP